VAYFRPSCHAVCVPGMRISVDGFCWSGVARELSELVISSELVTEVPRAPSAVCQAFRVRLLVRC